MQLVKSFTFDSAHQLVGHAGKCANLHGHTYKLEVGLEGPIKTAPGSDEGMVMDFGDIKTALNDLLDKLDHATLLRGDEPIAQQIKTKRVIFGFRTTAELMSLYIYWHLTEIFGPDRVTFVRLWETPTGAACATAADLPQLQADFADLFAAVQFYGNEA